MSDLREVSFLQGVVLAGISVPLPPPSVALVRPAAKNEIWGPTQCGQFISGCGKNDK